MIDKLTVQKRIMLATFLAFVFLVVYDYFYLSKFQPLVEANQTSLDISEQNKAPSTTSFSTNATVAVANQKMKSNPVLVEIDGSNFHVKIDDLGRISSFALNERKYKNQDGTAIDLIDKTMSPFPFEVRFVDESINNKAFTRPYVANVSFVDVKNSSAQVTLTQNLDDVIVTKNITFNSNGSYKLDISLNKKDIKFFTTPGSRPNVIVDNYTIHGALIRDSEGKLDIVEDGDVKGDERYQNANIAAASDRYYTSLFYNFDNKLNVVLAQDNNENTQVFLEAMGDFKTQGFIGPKHHDLLNSVDPRLTDVIEYGWFTFLAKPMFKFLDWLYGFTKNWGWSIVLMTLVIRALLFPLSYKGMMSMNKLKDLSPKIKELQQKYKDNPQKLQSQMMELYRKNGANPMGGCLPIVLQIPIFFAIYRVLLNAIELKGAPWIFWIQDLAERDPYFILPIAMGLLMFLQQKITPTTFTDPMQEKIMKYLPLVFVLFFFTFPAGLTLYWTINNMASIVQQYVINKMFKKHKESIISEKKHENRS